MSLGTITRDGAESVIAQGPVFFDRVSFLGDDSYPTGGTTGFDALIQAVVGDSRNVVGVIAEDCGGYLPVYAAGLLKVYEAAADGNPLDEVGNATDLSSVTFNLLVISK